MSSKIAVIYSSTYGHIRTLAEAIAEAAKSTGAQVSIFQFPEILSDDVLAKMHAAPKADYPIITANQLTEFDGFLFGIPSRYGRAVGAASAFFDQTGGLWGSGALVGKSAGIFTSSASQGGGQETVALTTIPFLAHHGITFVPIGFTNPNQTDNSEIVGGSAYGAGAIAGGDGSRGLTVKELEVAATQGKGFATFVNTFVRGKQLIASDASTSTKPIETEAAPLVVPEPSTAATVESKKEAAPTTTTTSAKPTKKSGGLFSMCCGGGKDNYET